MKVNHTAFYNKCLYPYLKCILMHIKNQFFEESRVQEIMKIQLVLYFLPNFESIFPLFFSIIVWEVGKFRIIIKPPQLIQKYDLIYLPMCKEIGNGTNVVNQRADAPYKGATSVQFQIIVTIEKT